MPTQRPYTSFEPVFYGRTWSPTEGGLKDIYPIQRSSSRSGYYNTTDPMHIPDFLPSVHAPPTTGSYETQYNNTYNLRGIANQWHRRSMSANPPRFRSGRAGGTWRHIKQTTGHGGSNIMFVDGVIKQEDAKVFPPYGINLHSDVPPIDAHYYSHAVPLTIGRAKSAPVRRPQKYYSSFNQRAKEGYKYWYEEKPPARIEPFLTIQGRQMALGHDW